ncbi:MAG TPA: purine nucleoside permease [Opitutaceae bacterium]|jgi:purine nucleoside permease|nr:purine nucleoside permease [Opitutaceae bacterium]
MRFPPLWAAFCLAGSAALAADVPPLVVKVVVVATFEVGKDAGDTPGEFQLWAEREKFDRQIAVPGLAHPVYVSDRGELAVVSGTTARCAVQLMALGLDPRFDFSHAYWILDGIAGVDPADASLASAAWAKYVVDGDVAYEIDSRETPADWPYSLIPIGGKKPNDPPKPEGWEPAIMAYPLNPALVDRAFALTKDVALADTPAMAKVRAAYAGSPNAQRPPFVLEGDVIGSCRFWHGPAMTKWANDWTALWTHGQGNFVMTAMEDQGYAAALTELAGLHRVDFQRVLVLRTASNYCTPPPGTSSLASLQAEFVAFRPSVESCYRVGSVVVHDILAHWDESYAAGIK